MHARDIHGRLLAALLALGVGPAAWSGAARASEITAREITEALFQASPGAVVDFSGKDLKFLDLSGLDFKGSRLSGADLYGVDLTGANLAKSDLSGVRLDRATLIRADFSGADLSRATLLRPTIFTDLAADAADAPRFQGANLTDARFMAQLDGASFKSANLTRAKLSPNEVRPGQGTVSTLMKNLLRSCDFTDAKLVDADLTHAVLTFATLVNADLTGAKLANADLSRADLTGADLSRADLTNADLDGAILTGVKGLETVKGLGLALHLDRATR